ncbi:SDR family NAD(P)-dependent oxidoreductase [Aquimarina macrocephali]|uniref:SDR family NAD(P)-dependent oxidoreductase n=1 Tax=Aquimarina macrocephali TaxID=666563 RepID=UPI003F6638E8
MSKTVFITGASRGIGFALSEHFIKNGYKVIGTSRTGEIKTISHNNFEVIKLDLSDKSSIKKLEELLEHKKLSIDILINNAGIGPDLYSLEPEEVSFENTFDVNVTGTVFLTELLSKYVVHGGKIINISSKMGSIELCELTDSVAYRMSKTAINMYAKILTNRFIDKIKVASVHPGWVRTTIAGTDVNGRISSEESASKIVDFVTSNFITGTFWDAETQSEIQW